MIKIFFNRDALRWCVYVTSLGINVSYYDFTSAKAWAEGFAASSGMPIHRQDSPK